MLFGLGSILITAGRGLINVYRRKRELSHSRLVFYLRGGGPPPNVRAREYIYR